MKINLKILGYVFLIIPFIKPYYFTGINIVNLIYNIWQIVNAGIILSIYMLKKVKISNYNITVVLIECIFIFSSIFNESDYSGAIINAIQVIIFCFIIDYGLRSDCKKFLKAMLYVLSFWVLANFVTIVLFKDGLILNGLSMWLLGRKNLHFSILYPMVICIYIYSNICGNKLDFKSIVLILIATISIFMVRSATSIIGIVLVWIYIIFEKIIKKISVLNLNLYFIMYLLLFFGIVIFNVQELFSFIIEDMLHKDLSFTGRTEIWEAARNLIKERWFLGYGNEGEVIRVFRFNHKDALHAHNMVLDILYQGGIVLLIFVINLLRLVKDKINKYSSDSISNFCAWSILIYLIMWLTEVYSFETIFWVFTFYYNIDILIDTRNKKISKKGGHV